MSILKNLVNKAKTTIAENYVRWDSTQKQISISKQVIGHAGENLGEKVDSVESVDISALTDSYRVGIALADGKDVRINVIPLEIKIDGDDAVVLVELPDGVKVETSEPSLLGVKLLFDRLLLGGRMLSKAVNQLEGVELEGKTLSYRRPVASFQLLDILRPHLCSNPRIPIGVDDGWLVCSLGEVLPPDSGLDTSAILKAFVSRKLASE